MQTAGKDHYATLRLDRRCTPAQIRAAYRVLTRRHHPDVNSGSPDSVQRTQELNAAHEILRDPKRRAAYDRELAAPKKFPVAPWTPKTQRNISQDVHLRPEDFLRGTTREVRVQDPANPNGAEIYELAIPPNTAPGTCCRLPRTAPFGGFIQLRVQARPGLGFRVRGSDLRCDLKIKPERAAQGGVETIPGITGAKLRVQIPRGIGRNEIVRVPGEGLPRPRGGRGDLLVRVTYQIKVRVTRPAGR